MKFFRVSLVIAGDRAEEAESILMLAGAIATSATDAADSPLFEPPPGTEPRWPTVRLTALFNESVDRQQIRSVLSSSFAELSEIDVEQISGKDWEEGLRHAVEPQIFGDRLRVIPADAPASTDGRTDVRLNLGLAFGTGRHATTALCLEWLEKIVGEETRLLDFGSGSGILAIAALRLGAASAWAVDNESQAITAARRNAELNDVTERLWVGTEAELPPIEPDVVVANILAATLQAKRQLFASLLVPAGRIALSGILENQVAATMTLYERDFHRFEVAHRDGWALLSAHRRI